MRKRSGTLYSKRLRNYKYVDKKRGLANDLTLEGVKALIQLPCYYCGKSSSGGLDRLDNDKGHESTNIVPSCCSCNYILSTLPPKAKLEMREGLRRIYEKNLLKDWTPVFMVPAGATQTEPGQLKKPRNALLLLESPIVTKEKVE